jgi:shikimate dehydrogenase
MRGGIEHIASRARVATAAALLCAVAAPPAVAYRERPMVLPAAHARAAGAHRSGWLVGARAVVWALRDAGAAEVRVWNRTAQRAAALAADMGVEVAQRAEPADLLVNCTAAGLSDPTATFKDLPVRADDLGGYLCVVDLVYGKEETALTAAARRRGCLVVDGLEVLVRQGALSFELWTGMAAPIEAMRHAAVGPAAAPDDPASPAPGGRGAGGG